MEMFTVKKKGEVLELLETEFNNKILETEIVEILNAIGRVAAREVISIENVPEFRRTTVDGYAIRSRDTVGCSESLPAFLNVIGEIKMGEDTNIEIGDLEAIYVPTGGIVPSGADAVVMIEYTEKFDEEIAIYRPVTVLENIVGIGDDVKKGEVLINKNTLIKTQHIGALAALGFTHIEVYKKPKIGIISTGDELIPINSDIKIGQIRDVNTYSLSGMAKEAGYEVVYIDRIKDDFNLIKESLDNAVSKCDIVLISGGSSVGNHDMTPDIINSLGSPGVLVHGIAIKPGKPTIVGKVGDTAIFGLPGHPAACMIAYQVIVENFINKTLLKMINEKKLIKAKSGFQAHVSSGRDVFYMVTLEKSDDEYIAHPIHGKSGMISLLSKADGYIEIGMEKEGVKKEGIVSVNLFR